jgi:opacity protein-like surface antigen
MQKTFLLVATAAATLAAAPASAQTGPYVGIEGGVLFPKRQNGTFTSTFSQTVQTPAAGTAAAAPGVGLVGTLPTGLTTLPGTFNGSSGLKYKRGYDVDAIAGYDFGVFRLEGELGYKRSSLKRFTDETGLAAAVNTGLNPTGATGTAFVFPTDNVSTFNLRDRVSVLSGMVNALLDIGGDSGLGFYAGGGAGRARVSAFNDRDSVWAYQGIAGVRFPVSENVSLGLKYRYFRTGRLDFAPSTTSVNASRTAAVANVAAPGGPAAVGSTNVNFTRTAALTTDLNDRFSSHSLLLSLVFGFGGGAREQVIEAAPPAPVYTAPPPAAPQTQTCPDGSVVLATDSCPLPPPPPPPPAAAPERG